MNVICGVAFGGGVSERVGADAEVEGCVERERHWGMQTLQVLRNYFLLEQPQLIHPLQTEQKLRISLPSMTLLQQQQQQEQQQQQQQQESNVKWDEFTLSGDSITISLFSILDVIVIVIYDYQIS